MPLFALPIGLWSWISLDCLEQNSILLPLCYIAKFLISYVASVLFVYLFIPTIDTIMAVFMLLLICSSSFKNLENNRYMAILPALKLPEQFGEAVPQLAIAVTFYYKNAQRCSKAF